MPAVSIESAGEHSFDLPHLRRSGAEELIASLLEKAGYYGDVSWRVRINEKQTCSGMTPPVSVIRFQEWGIYIRIKPGDNNTCHNVTLITPSGFKTNEVFKNLKTVEKSFNGRDWKQTSIGGKMNRNYKKDDLPAEVKNARFDVRAFLSIPDNVKAICLGVHLSKTSHLDSTSQFTSFICQRLNVNLSPRQGGVMMRSVMSRGFIKRYYRGTRHVGYFLTKKGEDLIKDQILPPVPPPVFESAEIKHETLELMNRAQILRDMVPAVKSVCEAASRLREIDTERKEHQAKIHALDEEEEMICAIVDGNEIGGLLSRLVDIKFKSR